jgi:hypothetical protein
MLGSDLDLDQYKMAIAKYKRANQAQKRRMGGPSECSFSCTRKVLPCIPEYKSELETKIAQLELGKSESTLDGAASNQKHTDNEAVGLGDINNGHEKASADLEGMYIKLSCVLSHQSFAAFSMMADQGTSNRDHMAVGGIEGGRGKEGADFVSDEGSPLFCNIGFYDD